MLQLFPKIKKKFVVQYACIFEPKSQWYSIFTDFFAHFYQCNYVTDTDDDESGSKVGLIDGKTALLPGPLLR
jgi:hypothetical protein